MIYNSRDFLEQLHDHAAMKFNGEVILDPNLVRQRIEANSDDFNEVDLEPFIGTNTLYGESRKHWHFKIGFSEAKIKRLIVDRNPPAGRRIMAEISYDGTMFFGFQAQSQERTVQSDIDAILTEINGFPSRLRGASRTDAGVHAHGQVIDFETARHFSADKWRYILNRRLPDDIHVKTVYFAPVLFHSRFDVLAKEYRYTLNLGEYDPLRRNYEWTVDELDLGTLEKNLKQLLGSHDFTSFCTGDKEDRVRTIFKADYEIEDDKLQLVFIGDGFLHHMLRLIVFQLVLIASGKVDYDIESLINDMSRRRTTRLAPSGGLCLEKVIY